MLRVALTGGIGSGKSTVSEALRALGVPILDADEISHQLTAPGQPAVAEIKKVFGEKVLTSDGSLDRARLRRIVFADAKERARLESILHPRVRRELEDQARNLHVPYIVFAIPLLVETGRQTNYDRVLVVDAPDALRIKWIRARSALSETEIISIIQAQANREARLKVADDVLTNNGSIDDLKGQVQHIHTQYLQIAAGLDHHG